MVTQIIELVIAVSALLAINCMWAFGSRLHGRLDDAEKNSKILHNK
jgi:hypothetical protein